MMTPSYLFQYTNINSLALILKSQKIRFTRLDKVNDTQEGLTHDFGSIAHYIFVSCFTETVEENLAMWNMYTPQMRGVRIQFEMPIFKFYKIKELNTLSSDDKILEDLKNNIIAITHSTPYYKINYTDDISKLQPNVLGDKSLYLNEIGTCKRTMWAIENEWRFRLNIFPVDLNITSDNFKDKFKHLVTENKPPSISFYDLSIDENVFKTIKILLGPKLQNGDIEIVEALIDKFNPTARIETSSLTGLIK